MRKIIITLLILLLGLSACGRFSDANDIQDEPPMTEDYAFEDETAQLEYKTVRWLMEPIRPFDVAPRGRGRDGNEGTLSDLMEIDVEDSRESIIERFGEPNVRTGSGMATHRYYTSDGFAVELWPDGSALRISIFDTRNRQRDFGLIEAVIIGYEVQVQHRARLEELEHPMLERLGDFTFVNPYEGEYLRLPLPVSTFIEDYIYIDRDLTLADALDIVWAGGLFDDVVDALGEPNGWQNHSGHIVYYYELSDGFWVLLYVGLDETGRHARWNAGERIAYMRERIVYNIEIIDLRGRRFTMFWRFDPGNPPPEWERWW